LHVYLFPCCPLCGDPLASSPLGFSAVATNHPRFSGCITFPFSGQKHLCFPHPIGSQTPQTLFWSLFWDNSPCFTILGGGLFFSNSSAALVAWLIKLTEKKFLLPPLFFFRRPFFRFNLFHTGGGFGTFAVGWLMAHGGVFAYYLTGVRMLTITFSFFPKRALPSVSCVHVRHLFFWNLSHAGSFSFPPPTRCPITLDPSSSPIVIFLIPGPPPLRFWDFFVFVGKSPRLDFRSEFQVAPFLWDLDRGFVTFPTPGLFLPSTPSMLRTFVSRSLQNQHPPFPPPMDLTAHMLFFTVHRHLPVLMVVPLFRAASFRSSFVVPSLPGSPLVPLEGPAPPFHVSSFLYPLGFLFFPGLQVRFTKILLLVVGFTPSDLFGGHSFSMRVLTFCVLFLSYSLSPWNYTF